MTSTKVDSATDLASAKIHSVKIVTREVNPPIPVKVWDWEAWVDGQEEGWIGRGSTEARAIGDLLTSLEIAHCPGCNSERIAERVAFNAESHGERSEQEHFECLECGTEFEESEAWL